MPSSTSNFEARALPARPDHSDPHLGAPNLPWGRVVATALVVFVVGGLGLEVLARSHGMSPELQDTARVWAHERARAVSEENVLAIVGTSQSQMGIDARVVAAELGRPVVQLAMNAASPLPVFYDLAEDDAFRGTVLLEVTPSIVFADRPDKDRIAQGYVSFYRGRSFIEPVEQFLRARGQTLSAAFRPELRPTNFVLYWLRNGTFPGDSYVRMRSDRTVEADFQNPRAPTRLLPWHVEPLPGPALEARIDRIARAATLLRAHGGETVLVRMPRSGVAEQNEKNVFPEARYWDRLVARVDGLSVHFEDVPGGPYVCGDQVHLDKRDAPRFTRALAHRVTELQAARIRERERATYQSAAELRRWRERAR